MHAFLTIQITNESHNRIRLVIQYVMAVQYAILISYLCYVLCSTNVGRHLSLCIPPMLHYCQCEWLILVLCTRWIHTAHWRKTAQSVCGDDALWHAQWSLTYTNEAPSIPNVRCSQAVTSAGLLHKYTVKSVKSAEPEGVYRGACEWDVLLCFAISGGYIRSHDSVWGVSHSCRLSCLSYTFSSTSV